MDLHQVADVKRRSVCQACARNPKRTWEVVGDAIQVDLCDVCNDLPYSLPRFGTPGWTHG